MWPSGSLPNALNDPVNPVFSSSSRDANRNRSRRARNRFRFRTSQVAAGAADMSDDSVGVPRTGQMMGPSAPVLEQQGSSRDTREGNAQTARRHPSRRTPNHNANNAVAAPGNGRNAVKTSESLLHGNGSRVVADHEAQATRHSHDGGPQAGPAVKRSRITARMQRRETRRHHADHARSVHLTTTHFLERQPEQTQHQQIALGSTATPAAAPVPAVKRAPAQIPGYDYDETTNRYFKRARGLAAEMAQDADAPPRALSSAVMAAVQSLRSTSVDVALNNRGPDLSSGNGANAESSAGKQTGCLRSEHPWLRSVFHCLRHRERGLLRYPEQWGHHTASTSASQISSTVTEINSTAAAPRYPHYHLSAARPLEMQRCSALIPSRRCRPHSGTLFNATHTRICKLVSLTHDVILDVYALPPSGWHECALGYQHRPGCRRL